MATRMATRNTTRGSENAGKTHAAKGGLAVRTALTSISNQQQNILAGKSEKPITRGFKKKESTAAVPDKENPVQSKILLKKEIRPLPRIPEPVKDVEPESPSPMETSNSYSAQNEIDILPDNFATMGIKDDEKENPQLVVEYILQIYNYLAHLERKYAVKERFLEGKEINSRMRGILVDWLVQVHMRFHLLQETLFLGVSILDRFLQRTDASVSRKKLQLVGVTAMWIASKYEEMYAPEIGDFVYITDNAYTKKELREMELVILKTLDVRLGKPLPIHFLRRLSKVAEVDSSKHNLAKYLMELTLVDYDCVHHCPSEIAAASLCLAMKILANEPWSKLLEQVSTYSESHLMPLMKKIACLVEKASTGKLTAIHTKYKSNKFQRLSLIPELNRDIIKSIISQ